MTDPKLDKPNDESPIGKSLDDVIAEKYPAGLPSSEPDDAAEVERLYSALSKNELTVRKWVESFDGMRPNLALGELRGGHDDFRDLALHLLRERDEARNEVDLTHQMILTAMRENKQVAVCHWCGGAAVPEESDESAATILDHVHTCAANPLVQALEGWKSRAEKAEAMVACSCDATGGEVHKPACDRWKVMRYEP